MDNALITHLAMIALFVNAVHFTSNKESRVDRLVGMVFSVAFIFALIYYINK